MYGNDARLHRYRYPEKAIYDPDTCDLEHDRGRSCFKCCCKCEEDEEEIPSQNSNRVSKMFRPILRMLQLLGFYPSWISTAKPGSMPRQLRHKLLCYVELAACILLTFMFIAVNVFCLSFNFYVTLTLQRIFGLLNAQSITSVITGLLPLQNLFNFGVFIFGISKHWSLLRQLNAFERAFYTNFYGLSPPLRHYRRYALVATLASGLVPFILRVSEVICLSQPVLQGWLSTSSYFIVPLLRVWQILPLLYFQILNSILQYWFRSLAFCLKREYLSVTESGECPVYNKYSIYCKHPSNQHGCGSNRYIERSNSNNNTKCNNEHSHNMGIFTPMRAQSSGNNEFLLQDKPTISHIDGFNEGIDAISLRHRRQTDPRSVTNFIEKDKILYAACAASDQSHHQNCHLGESSPRCVLERAEGCCSNKWRARGSDCGDYQLYKHQRVGDIDRDCSVGFPEIQASQVTAGQIEHSDANTSVYDNTNEFSTNSNTNIHPNKGVQEPLLSSECRSKSKSIESNHIYITMPSEIMKPEILALDPRCHQEDSSTSLAISANYSPYGQMKNLQKCSESGISQVLPSGRHACFETRPLRFYYEQYLVLTRINRLMGAWFNPFIMFSLAMSVIVLCLTIYFLTQASTVIPPADANPAPTLFTLSWGLLQTIISMIYIVTVCTTGRQTNECVRALPIFEF